MLSLSVAATAGTANANESQSVGGTITPDCSDDGDDGGGGGGGGGCLCPVDLNEQFSTATPQPV